MIDTKKYHHWVSQTDDQLKCTNCDLTLVDNPFSNWSYAGYILDSGCDEQCLPTLTQEPTIERPDAS